ncbi:hypothetical protein CEY05_04340 [Achromobacter sp. HZ34]|nr:hypothetical protein CEY05_04340 [Achromobacter sp. HZ34]
MPATWAWMTAASMYALPVFIIRIPCSQSRFKRATGEDGAVPAAPFAGVPPLAWGAAFVLGCAGRVPDISGRCAFLAAAGIHKPARGLPSSILAGPLVVPALLSAMVPAVLPGGVRAGAASV